MFIRKAFITNSSSTGFIAWGVVIPKQENIKLSSDLENGVSVRYVSDKVRAVCIRDSEHTFYSDTEADECIDEGVYLLEKYGSHHTAICTATMSFDVEEPPSKNYDEWQKAIDDYLEENGIDTKGQEPKWVYVRNYS